MTVLSAIPVQPQGCLCPHEGRPWKLSDVPTGLLAVFAEDCRRVVSEGRVVRDFQAPLDCFDLDCELRRRA